MRDERMIKQTEICLASQGHTKHDVIDFLSRYEGVKTIKTNNKLASTFRIS